MINEATLLGRVGSKESKSLQSGHNLTTLSIATTRKYNDSKGGRKESTTWHKVNCFNKLGEIAEKYINVGDLVYIKGEIQHRKVESGEKAGQYFYSVMANEIKLLPVGKKESSSQEPMVEDDNIDDSIPF